MPPESAHSAEPPMKDSRASAARSLRIQRTIPPDSVHCASTFRAHCEASEGDFRARVHARCPEPGLGG
eukprot:9245510-Alexandrium_andersonii.AAC.1